tara:strand:+ start:142 stop:1143 length:1002 start_codon:yes stop_codon:yes gene_type:complete
MFNKKTQINVPGKFVYVKTNKVTLRCRDAGPRDGPLAILVHGWPESWYSWRHQIRTLADVGYRVIIPDVRGYGGSDKPDRIEDYSMTNLVNDIVEIMDSFGTEKSVLIGHDWGAPIVWNTAALYPSRVLGVAGLSVPYHPRGKISSIQLWKSIYKDRFFYQLYFQQPGKAEEELDKDVGQSLRKIYYSGSGDAPKNIFSTTKANKSDMLSGLPDPNPFPAWLTAEDINYYISEYKERGFSSTLNRYRAQELDWRELTQLAGATISVPSCFIAGERDSVLRFVPNVDLVAKMKPWMHDLRICELIPNIGHWIQQESPDSVNKLLKEFVTSLTHS